MSRGRCALHQELEHFLELNESCRVRCGEQPLWFQRRKLRLGVEVRVKLVQVADRQGIPPQGFGIVADSEPSRSFSHSAVGSDPVANNVGGDHHHRTAGVDQSFGHLADPTHWDEVRVANVQDHLQTDEHGAYEFGPRLGGRVPCHANPDHLGQGGCFLGHGQWGGCGGGGWCQRTIQGAGRTERRCCHCRSGGWRGIHGKGKGRPDLGEVCNLCIVNGFTRLPF